MTLRVARNWQGSKGNQRLCWPPKGLERRQGGALVSRTPIRPRNHPFQGDKLSPQWSLCRAFWYWQDKRVGRPEILLAEPEKRRQSLCLRMWRLFYFKDHLPQALWRPTVLTCIDSPIERPFDRLCDRLTIVPQLKGWQLWLDPCHCWPLNQNGTLRASQSHHQYSRTSKSNYWRGDTISWPLGLHY